jgi:hypothetical protein
LHGALLNHAYAATQATAKAAELTELAAELTELTAAVPQGAPELAKAAELTELTEAAELTELAEATIDAEAADLGMALCGQREEGNSRSDGDAAAEQGAERHGHGLSPGQKCRCSSPSLATPATACTLHSPDLRPSLLPVQHLRSRSRRMGQIRRITGTSDSIIAELGRAKQQIPQRKTGPAAEARGVVRAAPLLRKITGELRVRFGVRSCLGKREAPAPAEARTC